jgi:hypothetical protein
VWPSTEYASLHPPWLLNSSLTMVAEARTPCSASSAVCTQPSPPNAADNEDECHKEPSADGRRRCQCVNSSVAPGSGVLGPVWTLMSQGWPDAGSAVTSTAVTE